MYVKPEQKLNRITNAHCYSVSPTCTKPNVCVQRSCLCDESWPLGGRSGATFTIKVVACCVLISWEVVNDAAGVSVRAERTVKRL